MQRTKYFNQTRPTDAQLDWTDNSKVSALRRRLLALSQMGIRAGFEVTVNGVDNTKVDVARGEGYTGGQYLVNTFEGAESGERIGTLTDTVSGEVDTGPLVTAQGLADYTLGVNNYISVVYAENGYYPLTERSFPFTAHLTVFEDSYTVSVLTETDWNALSADDLSNRVLVAIVTAKGAGSALTSADIEQFVQPNTLPTTSQPGVLAGVTIISVSDVTPLGTGTLRWDVASHYLYWTAPGDLEGLATTITASGSFTLVSNSTAYTMVVNVIYAALSAVASASEDIMVKSLYGRTIPMFSAVDQIHRDMVGTGTASIHNPHKLSINDISGGGFDHANLFHVNGISVDADPGQLECQIDAVNDRVQVTNLGGFFDSFLIAGNTLQTLLNVNVGDYGYAPFDVTPTPAAGAYLIYVDTAGALQKVKIAGYTEGAAPEWPLWTTNIKIVDMHNLIVGNGTLSWNATTNTMTYAAPGDGAGTAIRVPYYSTTVYYKLYSATITNWILIRVAGTLGGNNSSTFSIVKDETTYPDDEMLKLCVVNWTGGGLGSEQLTDLVDTRSYITADVRGPFEEEHDALGKHNKVIQHPFIVAAPSVVGVYGMAAVGDGVDGFSSNGTGGAFRAVVGKGLYASGPLGGYLTAPNTAAQVNAATAYGLEAIAGASIAVHASAPNIAISAEADTALAGNFAAPNTVVKAVAATDTAGWFVARSAAVYGHANLRYGIVGTADVEYAGLFSAPNKAVEINAAAVTGLAVNASSIGIIVTASNSAVYIRASAAYGLIVAASATAVSVAASSDGMYVFADSGYGIEVEAGSDGMYVFAYSGYGIEVEAGSGIAIIAHADTVPAIQATASSSVIDITAAGADAIFAVASGSRGAHIIASASAAYGIVAIAPATAGTGVYGSGGRFGVLGSVSHGDVANIYGIYGQAINTSVGKEASAVGVYGRAVSSGATGVAGEAAHVTHGTGVFGSAGTSGYGVYGTAGTTGIGVFGVASYVGVWGTADTIGVIGIANSIGGSFVGVTGIKVQGTIYYSVPTTDSVAGGAATALPASPVAYIPILIAGNTRYFAVYS